MLDERKSKILQIIVEDYIETAEPVGSRSVARNHKLGVSPATIRNEMSDLELMGYLVQPHTSAGRIPSAKGYRLYVDSLKEPGSLEPNDMVLINRWFQERIRNIDDIFRETAKILSRMTQNVSLVLANKESTAKFMYMKFLPLNDKQVIMCVVTDDGAMGNGLMAIPAGMDYRDLDYLAVKMSNMLRGIALSDIDGTMMQQIYAEVCHNDAVLTSMKKTISGIASQNSQQKVFTGGTGQLLNQPEFQDVDRVRELLGILEEEAVLKDLLSAGNDSGLRVTIGSENKFTGIKDCSMVQATYRLNGEIVGTMAVLGPTRMEYRKVISVMSYLHKYLETILRQGS